MNAAERLERVKKRMKIRLSKAQETALLETIASFHDRRPECYEYETVQRTLKEIPVPKAEAFANVRPGHYKRELVPLYPEFNAETDIAEGWCLYPCWDSGNNHRLINAAEVAWMTIWNSWIPQ